ncbi:MAG: hypothetical protein FWC95_06325 [Defluviitaleaceae bacterium]|nr:hypothetical protein [Defluviitaleaceae bacterium]
MIQIDKIYVYNFENAVRGARNAMNSWHLSDSSVDNGLFVMGEADLTLMKKLCKAGTSHRKFLRQIFVSIDITAPLYWWKEFDTYKVGTTANSQSTMHKLHAKPIARGDFSHDRMNPTALAALDRLIVTLEGLRKEFVATKDKDAWYSLIQLLPSSYNQMRTCTMSYENLANMYFDRKSHKLEEWRILCAEIASLPYFADMILI